MVRFVLGSVGLNRAQRSVSATATAAGVLQRGSAVGLCHAIESSNYIHVRITTDDIRGCAKSWQLGVAAVHRETRDASWPSIDSASQLPVTHFVDNEAHVPRVSHDRRVQKRPSFSPAATVCCSPINCFWGHTCKSSRRRNYSTPLRQRLRPRLDINTFSAHISIRTDIASDSAIVVESRGYPRSLNRNIKAVAPLRKEFLPRALRLSS